MRGSAEVATFREMLLLSSETLGWVLPSKAQIARLCAGSQASGKPQGKYVSVWARCVFQPLLRGFLRRKRKIILAHEISGLNLPVLRDRAEIPCKESWWAAGSPLSRLGLGRWGVQRGGGTGPVENGATAV